MNKLKLKKDLDRTKEEIKPKHSRAITQREKNDCCL